MVTRTEENNYPQAIIIAALIMGAFIGLSFWWVISAFKPQEELGTGGMVVNYGTVEVGMGNDYTSIEEPSMAPDPNGKLPDKVTPEEQVNPSNSQSSDQNIQTQNTEDAVSINTKSTKSTTAPTTATADKPVQPTVNQAALYKGKRNNATGAGDGTGNAPGNQGDVDGDPNANNYGPGGSGNGNTTIDLAKFNNVKTINDNSQKTGRIAVKVRVNKSGKVISAQAGVKGTQFVDLNLFRLCEDAIMDANMDNMVAGYENRSFIVIFNFKVK